MENRRKKWLAVLLACSLCLVSTACSRADVLGTESSGMPSIESSEESSSTGSTPASAKAEAEPMPDGELIQVTTFDGLSFDGKLRLPESGTADKLVIYVNGSGPNTYDNKRKLGEDTFNYHDLFAEKFTAEGAAYFSYNTRGVTMGTEEPLFAEIDDVEYQTYLPSNEVKDVESIIQLLKADNRLKDAQVYLLGWSAGTIIAPLVALNGKAPVDALLLAGYCNDTMESIMDWQLTGGSSMLVCGAYLDADGDGIITEKEYESDPYQVAEQLGSFAELDANKDGQIEREDFKQQQASYRQAVFDAIDRRDDNWLAENYGVRLTSAWFADYRQTAPNSVTMPKLDLPIYIFQGELDANVPVQQSYTIEKAFQEAGKHNLHLKVFGKHDHDLNYSLYVLQGTVSEGIQAIFDTVAEL